MSYNIQEIFLKMELELIVALRNQMKRDLKDENGEEREFKSWQELRLRSLEEFRATNDYIINKYADDIERLIEETLLDSYTQGSDKFVDEATKAGIQTAQWQDMDIEFFKVNDQKFKVLSDTINTDMDNALLSTQRRMDDVYRETLYKTQVKYGTGHYGLASAVDEGTKDFLAKGIDSITYKDGTKVNITSYVDMAIRTTNHRAYLMGEGKRRQEMGLTLIVSSAHATSCELCVPYQGIIMIDDVYSGGKQSDGDYVLLSTAIENNFLHPLCKHNLSTYFEGITTLPKVPDANKALENYQAEQRQREIERTIRRYKRLALGTIEEDKAKYYDNKVKEWQHKMRKHLNKHPQLRRAYNREKIY